VVKNKEVFTVKVNDEDVELAIKRPSPEMIIKSQKIKSKAWADALANHAPLRAVAPDILKEQGLWSDEEEVKFTRLEKELAAEGKKLLLGANGYPTKKEAIEAAIQLRKKREEFYSLAMRKNSIDNQTAEGIAEIESLNYLISVCTVYNSTGKPFFSGYEDYLARSNELATAMAANKYMQFVNNLDFSFEKNYPENQFLIKYGVINQDLRRVNKDGKLVDDEGNLVDELGRRIDTDGDLVNINGDKINEDGSLKINPDEVAPFPDENE
jgi:hypothetical protein